MYRRWCRVGAVFALCVSSHWTHGNRASQPAGGRADLGDDHPDAAESSDNLISTRPV